MEKEIRKFGIDFYFEWGHGYDVEISKIRADLDESERLGATHINIDHYEEYDVTYITIDAISEREETNHEFTCRIEEANRLEDIQKRQEFAIYNKLKLKYES